MACVLPVAGVAREVKSIEVDGGNQTATVAFEAGNEGDSHVLYYAWSNDGIDKGDNIENWPNVLRTGRVADTDTSATISLPAAAYATSVYAARAFLATSSANYDYLVSDGITSKVGTYNTSTYYSEGCSFDTGFMPVGMKTAIAVDAKYNYTGGQQYLLGTTTSSSDHLTCATYINGKKTTGGEYAYAFNNGGGSWIASGLTVSTGRIKIHIDGTVKPSKFSVVRSDKTATKTDTKATGFDNTAQYTLMLFCRNNNGSGLFSNATMYSCSITNDGVCVRNYLPARKDGVYGLYDTVNNTFGGSITTNAFTSSGTNISYSVTSGDAVVAVSPESKMSASSDFDTDEPSVVSVSVTSTTGGSKAGVAPLTLTGANNFGGTFTVNEGTLVADFGQGLASTDNLVLNGGSYRPTGSTLNATFGTEGGQIQATSGGKAGFSAYGGDLSVTVGDDATAAWSLAEPFKPSTLILNDAYGTGTLTMQNPFLFDTSSLTEINVGAGTAKFERGVTVTGTGDLEKHGAGTLEFDADVKVEGKLHVRGGTAVFDGGEGETPLSGDFGRIIVSNATLNVRNANIASGGTGSLITYRTGNIYLIGSTFTSTNHVYIGQNCGSSTTKFTTTLRLDGTDFKSRSLVGGYMSGGTTKTYNQAAVVVTNGASCTVGILTLRYGTMRQYEGTTVIATNDFTLGTFNSTPGTRNGQWYSDSPVYHLHGGTLEADDNFSIAYAYGNTENTATMYVYDGGTVLAHGNTLKIGEAQNDKGYLYVRGGSVTLDKSGAVLYAGNNYGSGLLEISDGGTVTVAGAVTALSGSGATTRTGVVTVGTNGTLTARSVKSTCSATQGTATLTLDGGKVVVGASSEDNFITGFDNAYIGAGGVVIDTGSRSPTIPQSFAERANQAWPLDDVESPGLKDLLEAPGLTKTGTGTLTLSGANTYKCATRVLAGTLKVSGDDALPETTTIRLAAGTVVDLGGVDRTVANLVGSGTVQNGTLTVTGTVWPGGGDNGTLAFASGATLKASKIAYEFNDAGETGTLEVAGALDLGGVEFEVANADARSKKSYTIVKAGSISGTPTGGPSGTDAVTVAGGTVRVGMAGFSVIIR